MKWNRRKKMSEDQKRVAMISEEVFNAVVDYLLSKPYNEVAQLVDAIKVNVQIGNVPQEPEVEVVTVDE